MLSGLERVNAHRLWSVPDHIVWGLAQWGQVEFLAVEQVGSSRTILYGNRSLGGDAQDVALKDLTDHRGNQLPATIASPMVIVRPQGPRTAYIVGRESDQGFKIARDPDATGPITTDLLVIEMGA